MFRAILVMALFICGCGGGSSPPAKVESFTPRDGLVFGYYFGNPLYMVEQADHVNLWWAVSQGPVWFLDMAEQLQKARGNPNIRHIVLHLNTTDPAELRFQFGKLSEMGYLTGWDSITVYPMDEPETPTGGNLSDAEVSDRVVKIRQVMFDTPGMFSAHVGVFYQCASGKRPGIKSFDRVGCFRHGSDGCPLLEADYAGLRSQLAIGAKLWVMPPGASINGKEGNQDPACWSSYAHRFLDVAAEIAFMFQSGADPRNVILGIRENGQLKAYCAAGKTILNPNVAPAC